MNNDQLKLEASIAPQPNQLNKVVCDVKSRQEFKGFFTDVLNQIDEEKFHKIAEPICSQSNAEGNTDYSFVLNELQSKSANPSVFTLLSSLKSQVGLLTIQTSSLMPDKPNIKNIMQIGNSGAYLKSLGDELRVTGSSYLVDESGNDLAGYAQNFDINKPLSGFRSYDKFLPIDDYKPITSEIPDNSIDLIVAYIGLHHIPEDKLDAFISSIYRVLSPSGSFVLREHDSKDSDSLLYAHAAHTVYNAVTAQEPPAREESEIRNFQPMSYWKDKMMQHSMVQHGNSLLQDNDPTLNTLIRFVKDDNLVIRNRPEINKYLTASEWNDVAQADSRAKFMEENPSYKYHYFSDALNSASVGFNSWLKSALQFGFSKATFSEYGFMNTFISTTSTLSNLYNGFKSLVVGAFSDDKSFLERQKALHVEKDYAEFIHHTPWYKFDFMKYANESGGFAKNPWFYIESKANELMAKIVSGSGNAGDDLTIDIKVNGQVSQDMVRALDAEAEVIGQNNFQTAMRAPRYEKFTEFVKGLVENNVKISEIAGNTKIVVRIDQEYNGTIYNNAAKNLCFTEQVCKPLYSWQDESTIHTTVEVNTEDLDYLIHGLAENFAELGHIYDL